MTVGKEMFLDIDGKQVGMEMIECQMAVSSKGVKFVPICIESGD